MKLKILKTQIDYNKAVEYLETLGDSQDFENNEDLLNEFELLSDMIENYEKKHFPTEPGDPIEIIKLKMEYADLKRKDLYPNIASKGVISEIFNKKRKLSKSMIRKFSKLLNIDQAILNVDYEIKKVTKKKSPKMVKFKIDFNLSTNLLARTFNYQNTVRQRGILFGIQLR